MKVILPMIAAIICIIILITGNLHWKDKTKVTSFSKDVEASTDVSSSKVEKKKADTPIKDDVSYIKNWPKKAQKAFKHAMKEGKTYKLAIVGSQVMGAEDGWANQLKNAMEETYGKEHLQVVVFSSDKTSNDFINDGLYEEVANEKPDMVLFEPFTLNDNGSVSEENNHENILTMISAIKKKNDQVDILIQPSNPIYGAKIYPQQVDNLKVFAKENDLTYLNHWTVWPDSQSDAIKKFLDEDGNPNEKGQQIWFEYLKEYFIAE
ncbi:SGNH/GDSL hydrolase family protein [Heyndrickxia sporothermodurans]|uniref:SGNH/GDSL hydrolase family protein n=1 Tax=Heyndrickxia sporothermodurans TaxID=46224 RepID=UPI002DBA2927|nr:SGNH/GDSL hydrolase family protein [Heyndrickxia sporothermodurans]MEB6548878.1 SGNH/GDSL hydrolase family protein [Heyndrickxia sporothermodurans]